MGILQKSANSPRKFPANVVMIHYKTRNFNDDFHRFVQDGSCFETPSQESSLVTPRRFRRSQNSLGGIRLPHDLQSSVSGECLQINSGNAAHSNVVQHEATDKLRVRCIATVDLKTFT